MNRGAIFVAGALSGALALGLVLVFWNTQAPAAPATTAVVPASPASLPPVELPAPQVPRGGSEVAPLPRTAVVVVPPSQPVPGELPVDPEAAPVADPSMTTAATATDPAAAGPLHALSLIIPVEGIGAAQLSDTFTDARGASRVHDAIDIMAPTGTPVRAVADGRIVKLFNSKPGGLTIYQFDATDTLAYYYAHLDRYADGLAEGQVLKQGDLVGYVGFTGNANPAGPHLHFAIMVLGPEKKWWQGAAINPYPYLRAAGSQ